MPLQRVLIILTRLRFDNKGDEEQRKETEAAAPISSVFKAFVKNCQKKKNYSLGEVTRIDEILIGFRGTYWNLQEILIGTTFYGFTETIALMSYVPRKEKQLF